MLLYHSKVAGNSKMPCYEEKILTICICASDSFLKNKILKTQLKSAVKPLSESPPSFSERQPVRGAINSSPRRCHVLTLGPCEYLTLPGKGDLVDVTK